MSERDRTFNAYNLPLLRDVELAGAWDVPALAPCDEVPDDLVGFNYVKSLRGGCAVMACISSLMIISSSVFGVVLIFMCGCWRVSGVC